MKEPNFMTQNLDSQASYGDPKGSWLGTKGQKVELFKTNFKFSNVGAKKLRVLLYKTYPTDIRP